MVLVVYGGLLALTCWQFSRTPTGFIPQQDKGYLLLNVQLPDSASVERTERIDGPDRSDGPRRRPGVEHTVGVSGQSLILNANAPNLGSMYVLLKQFDERRGAGPERRRHRRRLAGALPTGSPRGGRHGLRRAADRRPGHDRRLQADRRGPRQPRPGRAAAGQRPDRRPRQPDAGADGPVQQLRREHALALPGHRPRPSAWRWACRSATSSTRCRSTSARTTSTTSTSSAGPGR